MNQDKLKDLLELYGLAFHESFYSGYGEDEESLFQRIVEFIEIEKAKSWTKGYNEAHSEPYQ